MVNGKFTEHAQNMQGCKKCNLRKAVGNLEMPYGCEITVIAQEGLKTCYTSMLPKPTHTDQYLQWDSHHNLSAKFSVINILSHRAKTVCNNPALLKQEKKHPRKALTQCKYPKWALDKVEKRLNKSSSEVIDGVNNQGTNGTSASTKEVKSKGHIVIPYTQGLCESIKRSVVGMVSKLTSKVAAPSKTSWSPQGQRPHGLPK